MGVVADRAAGRRGLVDLDRRSCADRTRQDDDDRRRGHADGVHELDQWRRAKLRRLEFGRVAARRGGLRCALAGAPGHLGPLRQPRRLVPVRIGGNAFRRQVMRERRSLQAHGLRKVTLLVPEGFADGIRQFARELRALRGAEPALIKPEWRTVTPSAELLVHLECRARCAIRDIRAPGAARFHWTVTVLGRARPVAAGRGGEIVQARSLAEAALSAYVVDRRELPDGNGGDGNNTVPKPRPNIPKPNTTAAGVPLSKAAPGSPAGDS